MRVVAGVLLTACLVAACGTPGTGTGHATGTPPADAAKEAQKPTPTPKPKPTACVTPYMDEKAAAEAKKKLTADLKRLVLKRPGRITAMAKDLRSGAVVGYESTGDQQITASGAKVDILVTLLRQARAAHRKLSEWERATAEQMIEHSDNKAADALYARIGGASGVSVTYKALHLRHTHAGPGKYWGGTTTSPSDRVKLVIALAKGSTALNPADRAYALKLMEHVEPAQKWGVSAAARAGDRVSLKNGWTPRPFVHDTWAVTSYGWIHGPGRDYVISVQTDIQPGEGAGITTIESVSKLVAAHMSRLDPVRYRSCASPVAP